MPLMDRYIRVPTAEERFTILNEPVVRLQLAGYIRNFYSLFAVGIFIGIVNLRSIIKI